MDKRTLLSYLHALLDEKAAVLRADIASTLAARNSDTKSSAGDKHEVGRAMAQQELDQLEGQLAKLILQQQEIARIDLDHVHDRVGFGSLVFTDRGIFLIAIGLGSVELHGTTCFVISLASPIGQVFQGKRAGEHVDFQGTARTVEHIV